MFFLDLPISDELAALPFGFLLFQIPKIRSDVSTNQLISDELGTSLFLAFPKFPKMNRNAFTVFEVKRRPQSYLEDTFTAFSRSQPGLMHLLIRGLGS